MTRLLAVAAALAGLMTTPAQATYAGQVRSAAATFRLRGVDGHVITLSFSLRASETVATQAFRTLTLRVTDGGTRTYVTEVAAKSYVASDDLSVTEIGVPLGGDLLLVAWSSAAGYGALPPAADGSAGGTALTARRAARAVLLAGPEAGGGLARYARCTDDRASVATSVGAFTTDRPATDWPDAAPPGLRVKKQSARMFRCA
jgi:hypothetical protein